MSTHNVTAHRAFPELSFWNPEAPVINFINPGEFRVDEYLKKIGLEAHPLRPSFGCIDRKEIIRRQENIKFLADNPHICDLIIQMGDMDVSIPRESTRFMNTFVPKDGERSHFWHLIDAFLREVSVHKNVPADVKALTDFLAETASLRQKEQDMVKVVSDRLVQAVTFGGIINIDLDLTSLTASVNGWSSHTEEFGYRPFSFKKQPVIPDSRKYSGNSKIRKKFSDIMDSLAFWIFQVKLRAWARPLIVKSAPEEVHSAILQLIRESFTWGSPFEVAFRDLVSKRPKIRSRLNLTVGYKLDADGLNIRLLSVQPELFEFDNQEEFIPININNGWFSRKIIRRVSVINEKAKFNARRIKATSTALNEVLGLMQIHTPELLDKGVTLNSDTIVQVLSWKNAVGVIGLDPTLMNVYRDVESLRTFVSTTFKELRQIVRIVEAFQARSQAWNLDLHFPKILDDSAHLISFKRVVPINLIGREKAGGGTITSRDIAPITSLEPLNGNLLGLTGQNCGGKTVTQEEYAFLVFMAQSGFPILGGEKVELNVKNTIGMVFVERGEGSMVELMMKKTGLVIREALKHPRNGTLVILDELGSGTQESSGAAIGETVLKHLHTAGVSVVFSTQITSLAEVAERKFGAKCFAFDLNHRIRPGIGSGNPEAIIRELGYDDLLGLKNN